MKKYRIRKFMKSTLFHNIVLWGARVLLIFVVFLFGFKLAEHINHYTDTLNKVQELETQIIEIQKDTDELWKNIDALSENYTTLWINLYGEDSWYESSKDKEKVQKDIESLED